MKKLLVVLIISLAPFTVLAQGRIVFENDSLHLAYYWPDPRWSGGLAGLPVSSNNMPAGVTLVADLYMGTSSGLLSLYTTAAFGSADGKWNPVPVLADGIQNSGAPAIPRGTTVYIVTQIRDQALAAPSTWTPGTQPFGAWYGASQEFTFVLGTSTVGYPPMYQPSLVFGGGFSTWPVGDYSMDSLSPGFRGAIVVSTLPEPTSFALAALGAAAMLVFRRRK